MMIVASAGSCVGWTVGVRVVWRATGLVIKSVAASSLISIHSTHWRNWRWGNSRSNRPKEFAVKGTQKSGVRE